MKLTISLSFLLLLIFFFVCKNRKTNKENPIYIKEQKQKKGSVLLCLLLPLIYMFCTYLMNKMNLENTVALWILLLPLSLHYSTTEKEAFCSIEKIYYKEMSKEEIKLFKKACIKLIKTNEENKVTYENEIYEKIKNSKKEYDNYLIAKRCTISTYIPLVLSYFLFLFLRFPFRLSFSFVLIVKIVTLLTNTYLYKKIPEEKNLMDKGPYKITNKINNQESFFLIMRICLVLFAITLPYMYFLANLEEEHIALTIYMLLFLFSNLWLILYEYSESAILLNVLKIRKTKEVLFYIILILALTILITILKKPFLGIQNYFACFLTSLFFISPLEIIKIARFTKIKGVRQK